MPSGARRGKNETLSLIQSPVTAVGSPIVLPGIDAAKPHCFAGAKFYSDAEGTAPVTPTAGTIDIDVETVNSSPKIEPIPANTINAGDARTIDWAANTTVVHATPTGITGAAFYRIVVTCNEN